MAPGTLRILLLQARAPGDPMKEHEHACFAARMGLGPESVVPHDLCAGPPRVSELENYDALTVGGSGEFYVSKGNLPEFDAYLDFLREVVGRGHPTFASCFGHQSLVRALGGEIVYDPPASEVGTYELTLTAHGSADPLFGSLPHRFKAQLGHRDRATSMGEAIVNLASSERSPFQALRVSGQPIWATQFHPELDRKSNLARFRRYMRDYAPDDEAELAAAFDRFEESPEASSLLERFLRLVFD